MKKHIIDDAKRCVQCKNPSCRQGCPVQTPMNEAIKLLLNGRVEEAGKMLFENNPLSLVCSYICPQENQCEGHCILGKKGTSVYISAIEQYISDFYLSIYKPTPSFKADAQKVAVIGSGPAGLAIAFELSRKGYNLTIFEGQEKAGGILRYGIPEFRLPKIAVERLVNVLVKSGVKIRPNTSIGMNLTIDDLFRDGYEAVFVGTGVWRPYKLNIKGESLGHVHFAIEYLRNPDVYSLGNSIIVIGAGNVAMDVARTAIRHTVKDVTVYCHLDESGITADVAELEHAKIDGARVELRKIAQEITEEGVIFADAEINTDENGIKHATPIAGTEKLYPADSVIVAVGQGPRSVIVSSTKGITITQKGLVAVDEVGHTSRAGVFAGGDVVTGAKTVVQAVVVAKKVAAAMDEYLTGIRSNK